MSYKSDTTSVVVQKECQDLSRVPSHVCYNQQVLVGCLRQIYYHPCKIQSFSLSYLSLGPLPIKMKYYQYALYSRHYLCGDFNSGISDKGLWHGVRPEPDTFLSLICKC